ncbi:MAG: VOC family protein [bacterium]
MNRPTLASGKVCYLEIPTVDVEQSASFYGKVLGWRIRRRGDGDLAFDDAVNEVSGTWVTGRPPSKEAGLLVHIMVDDIQRTMDSVIEYGGRIVQPVWADAPEITARFSDPAGNVLGIFQEPTLKK